MSDAPLVAHVAASLARLVPADARCLVAVSGGPDSLALLDLLHLGAATHGRALLVAHVDHGIHPESAHVADRVRGFADARGLAFEMVRLDLAAGASETTARTARRGALEAIARDVHADAILLAHHADDQVETILMRLLRGSGPAGLAGMAAQSGVWLRPLLDVRRVELHTHLAARGIVAWQDPANADTRHLRSWIRQRILPELERNLPDVTERLLRTGAQAASDREAWDAALDALPCLDLRTEPDGISVAASSLAGYRSALRHAVVAAMGRRLRTTLGAGRRRAVDQLLDSRRDGAQIRLEAGLGAELWAGRLTFFCIEPVGHEVPVSPGFSARIGPLTLQARNAIAATADRDGWTAAFAAGAYVARPWRAGDRIRPLGGTGSRPVAVLFREARIPPHLRVSWPMLVANDDATVVWVPGICRSDARIPPEGAEALHVDCALA